MRDGFLRSSNFQRNAYRDTWLIYTLWSSMVKSICSSGFSLSGSRVPNSMPRVFLLSLSLSPRRIPFPSHSDCRISLERFESPRSNDRRFDDSKHELFLLEHLAVIKRFRRRRKGEKRNRETLPSLEDDKKRIRKQRFQARSDNASTITIYEGKRLVLFLDRPRISLREMRKLLAGSPC